MAAQAQLQQREHEEDFGRLVVGKVDAIAEIGEDVEADRSRGLEHAEELPAVHVVVEGAVEELLLRKIYEADQSTDELEEVEGIDAEFAAKLIMKAREPWFAEAE